jgi:hypothetical protein
MLNNTGKIFCKAKGSPPPPMNLNKKKYINSFLLKKYLYFNILFSKYSKLFPFKKYKAIEYKIVHPIDKDITDITVPYHFPKTYPATSASGEANPNNKIHMTIKIKNKKENSIKF